MSNISILIADDDFNKIELIIKPIKENYTGILSITQASNVYEAIEVLRKDEFHLLITDLQMPLKHNEAPDDNGGKSLIRSMYKGKNKANIPMYIVGLTQFVHLSSTFESVWKVWHFDNTLQDWKINLRNLITHISLVKSRIATSKIETLYVEGPTDKMILEHGIKLYFPETVDKIQIDTLQLGGGASWVERQLFIWAKSLNLKNDGVSYLKAVGLFDDDQAGNDAINKLRKAIDNNSAESKTFSIIKSSAKYSPLLKSLNSKGLIISTTIEELIPIECWKIAKGKGWLQKRIRSLNGGQVSQYTELDNEVFTDDEILILDNKINDRNKVNFCNYVCGLNSEYGGEALICIKYLLQDIFIKLKLS